MSDGEFAEPCCTVPSFELFFRVVVWLAVFISGSTVAAQTPRNPSLHLTAPGTSDKVARNEAARAMPFDRLRPEVAKRIHAVVSQPTVFRRLPVSTIESDPDLFTFLVRNPEVVIGIWKVMGVTSIDLKRTGKFRFKAHDGMGTASEVDLVYGTPNVHLYFGQGMYQGSLFKAKVFGQCVMLLRSVAQKQPNGQTAIRNVLDVFIKLDSPAIDLVARTFQPLFIESADINFTETSKFLMRLSKTAELNPSGVEELAGKLPAVSVPVQNEFARHANQVAHKKKDQRGLKNPIRLSSGATADSTSLPPQAHEIQTSRLATPNRFMR